MRTTQSRAPWGDDDVLRAVDDARHDGLRTPGPERSDFVGAVDEDVCTAPVSGSSNPSMVSICNLVDDCDAETDSSLEIVHKRSTNPSDTATACTSEIRCPKGEALLGVYSSGFPPQYGCYRLRI